MDYRKNYINIYIWQTISVLLGFASLLIVVPYISSNKIIYGIYSVCTSLTIFFSYADLGFLSSGVKYAAEYYVKGEHKEEIKIIGFTSFVMVSVFAILALGIIILGISPKLLIPELVDGSEQMRIARWLLFTLAVSCPIIIGQRLMGLVYTIRVEDYKFQRINIAGNLIRILSVFFFFEGGRYMIVEYYIFYQFVNLMVVVIALLFARKNYNYGFRDLLRAFRFDKQVFNKVKGLTGASLIIMLTSVVYYELDQVVISNVIGLEAVAVYAAALSALQLVRTFCGIVYSPYISRYNHFVGLGDYEGLTHFVKKIIILLSPVLVVPVLTLSINSTPFVISWVGEQYRESAILVSFLVLSFLFNFVKEPINQFLIATERNRVLIRYSILTPVLYWIGIAFLISSLSTKAFAIMKFVAPLASLVAYWVIAKNEFEKKGFQFLKLGIVLKTFIPTVVIVFFVSWIFNRWMIDEHTKLALLINVLLIGVSVAISIGLSMPFNNEMRTETINYMKKFKDKHLK